MHILKTQLVSMYHQLYFLPPLSRFHAHLLALSHMWMGSDGYAGIWRGIKTGASFRVCQCIILYPPKKCPSVERYVLKCFITSIHGQSSKELTLLPKRYPVNVNENLYIVHKKLPHKTWCSQCQIHTATEPNLQFKSQRMKLWHHC